MAGLLLAGTEEADIEQEHGAGLLGGSICGTIDLGQGIYTFVGRSAVSMLVTCR